MAKHSNVTEAMHAVSAAGLTLVKDAENPFYGSNYATLGNVLDLLRPHLLENGLTVEQYPDNVGPHPALTTLIVHAESDTARSYTAALVLDKDNPQGLGSAITYMRRYALCAAFGLDADEDDDGNAASPKPTVKKKKAAPKAESAPAQAPRVL